ncbi:ABC transporter substrate-binding protein [Actinomadura sp. HBU206391]|uniref:ABC transporter substrate-binding protein n=1 Tax=Actinomadura sp. HBU206391 TaxID=2731692 RepID=UPI001650675D|nr:ABC transporter substrate-binding protein [Actinomadura sp. HBU206391]MBC6459606.1 ABC transporter substrate-binding protein [Actinomadura sp. HBU206391]
MRSVRFALTALAAVGLLAAGCGSGEESSDGPPAAAAGFTPPKIEALKALGPGEGQVNIVAWAGYVEDGSNDKSVDWVSSFTKETGCKVNTKIGSTSDEMLNLMKTGQYDVVSASGDASLRLIAGGTVAPFNTSLTPNYAGIYPDLKNKPWNSVNGVAYGMPHGRGANMLMYNTKEVKPAPDSWSVVFDPNSPYKGKITAYDSPIYIADAALYLMSAKPELGIKDPYALDQTQLKAAVDLLKQQKPIIGEYWSDYTKAVQSFKSSDTVAGTTWQVIANLVKAEKAPVETVLPKEGGTGWNDTWMVAAKAKNPNCAYKWLNHIADPKVNAQATEYFGEAPSNPASCKLTKDKNHCETYHAGDTEYWKKVHYWTTPIPQCLDGRTDVKCTDYAEWTRAWTEIKG